MHRLTRLIVFSSLVFAAAPAAGACAEALDHETCRRGEALLGELDADGWRGLEILAGEGWPEPGRIRLGGHSDHATFSLRDDDRVERVARRFGIELPERTGDTVLDRLRAMGRMAAPESLSRLESLAGSAPGDTGDDALLWLARLAPERARASALDRVRVPIVDRERAEAGVLALSVIGDDAAVARLIELLREPSDIEVKKLAFWMLSSSEHPRAEEMFDRLLGVQVR